MPIKNPIVTRVIMKVRSMIGRPDRFIEVGSSWISSDGNPMSGILRTPNGKWTMVVHPYWWAARRASRLDRFPKIRNTILDRWVAGVGDIVESPGQLIERYPIIVRKPLQELRDWAYAGRLPRCQHKECGIMCKDVLGGDDDAIWQANYNNIAKLDPWHTRYQRDVFSAMLDTAPQDGTFCWIIRNHIVGPGGGSFLTLLVLDASWIWFGQIRSINDKDKCALEHEPLYDSCPTCSWTDTEFWMRPGDGLA